MLSQVTDGLEELNPLVNIPHSNGFEVRVPNLTTNVKILVPILEEVGSVVREVEGGEPVKDLTRVMGMTHSMYICMLHSLVTSIDRMS
jgi:hypothetical protein